MATTSLNVAAQTVSNRRQNKQRSQTNKTETIQLHRTTDLSKFRHHPLNRELSESHILALAEDIRRNGFKREYPIRVNMLDLANGYMTVVCGHHRLEAAKRAKSDVWFTYTTETEPQKERVLPWRGKDYLQSFSKAGMASYKVVLNWMETTGLSMSHVLRILHYESKGKSTREQVVSGRLTLTKEELENLRKSEQVVLALKEQLQITAEGNSKFFSAVLAIIRAGLWQDGWIKRMGTLSVRDILRGSRVRSVEEGMFRLEEMVNRHARLAEKKQLVFLYRDYLRSVQIKSLQNKK